MTELSDLCIHKDIQKAKQFMAEQFKVFKEEYKAPIGHCKECQGRERKCFYFYPLNAIERGYEKYER